MSKHTQVPWTPELVYGVIADADKDHTSAVELINAYRRDNGEPPSDMLTIWNAKHEKYIDKYARVKTMIDTFGK